MSVYGATTTAYAAPTTTYAAAPATYAAPMASYGAAMPAYGAGMSYVPQATYSAYGGMQASPYLSTDVIDTQKLDATNALKNQHKQQSMQLDMAKQQRDMMITSQAAQMQMDAQQHKLQLDMQTKMASLYSSGMA